MKQAMYEMPADVLVQQLDGEAVLLHLGSGKYFGLDETALAIWNALLTSDSLDAAHATVLEQFDVEPERLRSDVSTLLQDLLTQQLLKAVE